MPQLGVAISGLRVGDQAQKPQDPPQPRRIQPTGRRHQHRLGLHSHLLGEVLGAMSQHPGMSHRELPTKQRIRGDRQRTTEHGPGGPHEAGRGTGPQPQPGPQPGRRRADLLALVSPGSAPTVDHRQLLEPLAFQPVHQPRRTTTCSANTASVSRFRSCAANPSMAATSAVRVATSVECVFESMAVTYQPDTRTPPPSAKLGTTSLARDGRRIVVACPPGQG